MTLDQFGLPMHFRHGDHRLDAVKYCQNQKEGLVFRGLSLRNIISAFYMLAFGYVLSLFTFVGEKCISIFASILRKMSNLIITI